ncbi:hypothetical protein ABW19_dt0209053 [Dactylella cylindrospora]|nr:hypothetical protein ABW19_dt0209053 [Dactylella cylindrospora]
MVEDGVKNVLTIISGVFSLVQYHEISEEFRYEAKVFLEFAREIEMEKAATDRVLSLEIQTIENHISAHTQQYPSDSGLGGCKRRHRDSLVSKFRHENGQDPQENGKGKQEQLERGIEKKAKAKTFTAPVKEYIADIAKRTEEEGWDDGKPRIQRVVWGSRAEEVRDESEKEQEMQLFDQEDALKYIEECQSIAGDFAPRQRMPIVGGLGAKSAQPPTQPVSPTEQVQFSENLRVQEAPSGKQLEDNSSVEGSIFSGTSLQSSTETISSRQLSRAAPNWEPAEVKVCPRFPKHRSGVVKIGEPDQEPHVGPSRHLESGRRTKPQGDKVENILPEVNSTRPPSAHRIQNDIIKMLSPIREEDLEGPEITLGLGNPRFQILRKHQLRFGPRPGRPRKKENTVPQRTQPQNHVEPSRIQLQDQEILQNDLRPDQSHKHQNAAKVPPEQLASTPASEFTGSPRGYSSLDVSVRHHRPTMAPQNPSELATMDPIGYDRTSDRKGNLYFHDVSRAGALDVVRFTQCGENMSTDFEALNGGLEVCRLSSSIAGSSLETTNGCYGGYLGGLPELVSTDLPNKGALRRELPHQSAAPVGSVRDIAKHNLEGLLNPFTDLPSVAVSNLFAEPPKSPARPMVEKPVYGVFSCGHHRKSLEDNTCNELVVKTVPFCDHESLVSCSQNMKHFRCWIECNKPTDCGHICHNPCHQCLEEVKGDGTPVWAHRNCRTCSMERYLIEKQKKEILSKTLKEKGRHEEQTPTINRKNKRSEGEAERGKRA